VTLDLKIGFIYGIYGIVNKKRFSYKDKEKHNMIINIKLRTIFKHLEIEAFSTIDNKLSLVYLWLSMVGRHRLYTIDNHSSAIDKMELTND